MKINKDTYEGLKTLMLSPIEDDNKLALNLIQNSYLRSRRNRIIIWVLFRQIIKEGWLKIDNDFYIFKGNQEIKYNQFRTIVDFIDYNHFLNLKEHFGDISSRYYIKRRVIWRELKRHNIDFIDKHSIR